MYEYLAVMDLSAEFYLQTCDTVFIRHALPKGEMTHRGRPVDPSQIHGVALMTVEGENDDISGVGQTEAAHLLCPNIPAQRHLHWLQPGVGHYGVFNGERFRTRSCLRWRISFFQRRKNKGIQARRWESDVCVEAGSLNIMENVTMVDIDSRIRCSGPQQIRRNITRFGQWTARPKSL
ncbi:hypothetical protein [Paraburkholderia mimosarum]|uniref:hypothetical protein n=1 Tax=Paraburkholderia mimosarum TaxID=312026 RepID=UPI002351D226|nr:hypothetical protein [Paraburkholderia mimosarum]